MKFSNFTIPSYGPDDEFDAKQVKDMLKEWGLNPDFTAGELLRVWRNW